MDIINWKPKGFEDVDKNVLTLANAIVSNNMISNMIQEENGSVKISFPDKMCTEVPIKSGLFMINAYEQFLNDEKPGIHTYTVSQGQNLATSACSRSDKGNGCGYRACPFIVAAYLKHVQEQEGGSDTIKSLEEEHSKNLELNIQRKIDDLILSDDIKEQLNEILRPLRYLKINREKGIKLPKPKFGFAFLGNDGTGKKEVAYLLAEMFYNMGYYPRSYLHILEYDKIVNNKDIEAAFSKSVNRVLLITGINYIELTSTSVESRDDRDKTDLLNQMILKYSDQCTIILAGEKNHVLSYIASDKNLRKVFQRHLYFEDLTNKELYQSFVNLCKKRGYKIEDGFEQAFYLHIEANKKQSQFENREYVEYLFDQILINECLMNDDEVSDKTVKSKYLPKNADRNKDVSGILNELIGMKPLKNKVRELRALLEFNKKIQHINPQTMPMNLHMMFTGNPGTGKTTVARIITKILFDLGYIKENKLIEVEKKDLVAKYVGQTAPKTAKVIEIAKGGVLFIDEAYSITQEERGSFGDECIATLIKAMEDQKENLVVIFAGYKREMMQFVGSNSGISSRIGTVLDFKDYTNDELLEMFKMKTKKYGYIFEGEIDPKATKIIKKGLSVDNFGNGRFIDSMIQSTLLNHAVRTEKVDEVSELLTIRPEDIPDDVTFIYETETKHVGFLEQK